MKALVIASLAFVVAGCGSPGIDPQAWTCENLKARIIEMSQTRRPRVLEIGQIMNENNLPGELIECTAMAEWAEGSGAISYGAHISGGGSVIIEYRQQ